MSIKDLFDVRIKNIKKQYKTLASASVGAESPEYILVKQKKKEMYIPPIDFSTASNFAKYGSAKLYYEYAFKRIYNHYPYDGTLAEKTQFEIESTHLDRYVFEYLYPRTNGYINFGYQGFDGTVHGTGYNNATVKEYVFVLGGIHTASGGMTGKPIHSVFEKSNVYDVSNGAKKGASLEFTPVSGSTVEFWLKKDAFLPASASKEVIFDLWNQEAEGASTYGRYLLNIDNSNNFTVTYHSGAVTGVSNIAPSITIADGRWHHYAVSMQKKNNKMNFVFYRDGTLVKRTTNANVIGNIKGLTKGLSATIGALNTAPSGAAGHVRGDGKFSGSMDEFRYWKKARNAEEVGLDWFSQVGGGTNDFDANKELGLYFKFNEGITGTDQDSVVLDYSGRIANGVWTGYTAGARNTGSALVISGKALKEYKDPIIYSTHPNVVSKQAELIASGTIQDYENNNLFYHLLPDWVTEEDTNSGKDLKHLCQILASYFDTAHAQISGMNNIRDITYSTGSLSPNVLSNDILRDRGFVMPDMFVDADIIETFRAKDKNEIFKDDISKVKNIIYQNIYNNLTYIFKTKGTEKSYRNLFRNIGFDTELVKVNMYCDNSTLLIEDRYEMKSVVKPVVKFNAAQNMSSTVYQYTNGGLSYITASGNTTERFTSLTLETEFILPKKLKPFETGYFSTPEKSASIAGFHRARTTDSSDYTWHSSDNDIRLYARRDERESEHVRFVLTGGVSTGEHFEITSSLYRMAYNNQKWLLAARVRHVDYPYQGMSSIPDANQKNYIVEMYGINTNGSYIDNGPFVITASISNQLGSSLLCKAKRVYAGAHRTNFTGAVLQQSDIHLSRVRYWQSYIDDETLQQHSFDSTNYGTVHAASTDSLFAVTEVQVPRSETLALHWDFTNVTGSDAAGTFTVFDRSSGSISPTPRYSYIGDITRRKYDGKGDKFPASSLDVVDKANIFSGKRKPAEVAYSSDGVKIVDDDKEAFFQDDDRNDIYFSFEKSPYGAISDEMINMFATVKDFSNMIGLPVNRFRQSYKTADYLRQLFFESVTNIPDPERYFEYFKWIDTSVSYAIQQLLPASTNTGDSIKNIVESHILERNKFREKFPFTSERVPNVNGGAIGAENSKVNWAISHAPQPQSPIPNNIHCVWQKTRRRFSDPEPTPAPISAPGIDALRDVIHQNNIKKLPNLLDNNTGKTYEGGHYAIRRVNRPYTFEAVFQNTIHGGTNYFAAKKRNFVHEIAKPHGPVSSVGIPENVMVVGIGEGQGLVNQVKCDDALDPNIKTKYDFHAFLGQNTQGAVPTAQSTGNDYNHQIKGIMAFPMNFMSQSVSGGYADDVNVKYKTKLNITNLHSDTVDITNDIPMQGPFTEMHVGGHQSRHIPINKYDATLIDDETGTAPTNNLQNLYTRPEAWRLLVGEHSSSTHQDGALGLVPADYGVTINVPTTDPRYGKYPDIAKKRATFYREEKAKRPVNLKNIKHSADGSRIGNFNKRYETFCFVGQMESKFHYRENSDTSLYLPTEIANNLPDTTHVMSLIGRYPSSAGNVFGVHLNNLQPDNHIVVPGTAGTSARGSFTVSGSSIAGTIADGSFTVTGSTVAGSTSSGSFVVKGSTVPGTAASGSFRVKKPPTYAQATGTFTVKSKDFVVPNDELRIASPADSDDFQINGASSGHFVSTGSTPSTPSNITTFYNTLRTQIVNETIYNTTSFVETTPNYGIGVTCATSKLTSTLAGVFRTDHWGNTGAWSAAFWIHATSSATQTDTLIFAEKTNDTSGNGASLVDQRRIRYTKNASSAIIKYERTYGTAGGPTIAQWAVELDSPLELDRYVHVVIRQAALAGTTGNNAIPDVRIKIGDSEELDPTPTLSGVDASQITTVPTSNRNFNLFSDGAMFSFAGGLDEFALWNVNLKAEAGDVLYNNNLYKSRSTVSGSNLQLYLRLGDDWAAGQNATDADTSNNFTTGDIFKDSGAQAAFNTQNVTASFASVGDLEIGPSIYESQGFATFTVKGGSTSTGTGSAYQGTITNLVGSSFNVTDSSISSSVNSGFATDGDTLTIGGTTFELNGNGSVTGGNTAVSFSHNENDYDFYNRLSQAIKDNTVYDTIQIITVDSTEASFHVTSSTVGAALNGDISETGTSFSSITQTEGGTDETGATDNDTLTINLGTPQTFRLQNDGGSSGDNDVICGDAVGSISNATFWNNLRSSIQSATGFSAVSYVDNGNNTATFHLTSSAVGSNQNATLSETGNTFSSLSDLEGGFNPSGSVDNDTLTIDTNGAAAQVFRLQGDGGSSSDNDVVCGPGITSTTFWNNLRSSIQTATGFSAVTYTANSDGSATFHITASAIGTTHNATLSKTGTSFTSLNNMTGGTNDTDRAIDGHSVVIDGVTFELDKDSSVTDSSTLKGIDFGTSISSTDLWNSLSQSIKDNTVYDTIDIETSDATQATFHLTSSTTGSALNVAISKSGTSFYSLSGMASGSDPVPDQLSSDTVLAVPGRNNNGDNTSNETIIVSRFAAPGGVEIESAAYLDVYFRERSVHNALPYRNLTVRGKGSGEATTIRLNTHLDKREGLATLLTRHCGKFGTDSKHGAVDASGYNVSPSYHKQHRNTSMRYVLTGAVGSTDQTLALVSRHDNVFISSPIPRSDFQYGWVNSTISGSDGWRTNQNIAGYAPQGGVLQKRRVVRSYANFSQNSSRINIGTAAKWDALIGASSTSKSMTFSAWIKPRPGAGIRYILSFGGDVQLYINNTKIVFRAKWNSDFATWESGGSAFVYDTWSHVLVRYAATGTFLRPYIYVNGVDLGAPTQTGTTPSIAYSGIAGQDCFIGGIASNDFDGFIDNVAIWNSAISIGAPPTAATVYALGQDGDPTGINTSSLKLHYKLGEGFNPSDYLEKDSSSKFFDSSGNGNHSVSVTDVTIAEDEAFEDISAIVFPSISEIFGV